MPISSGLVGEFHGAAAVPNVGNILTAAESNQERCVAPCAIREVKANLPPRERGTLPGWLGILLFPRSSSIPEEVFALC